MVELLKLVIYVIASFSGMKGSNMLHVQELREIATTDGVKGKHFFLETDIKGPSLKLDNTGRALLTVSSSYFFGGIV